MALENLTIERVCLHEVYRLSDANAVVPPNYAADLMAMDARASAAFVSRVTAAFQNSSQCMDMAIRDFGPGSAVAIGSSLPLDDNAAFIVQSRALADALVSAQTSRAIPGGLVVVFDGTVGYPARRFFGVMKAELHDGFLKGANLQATFVDNLFLSPKTKLYKIGMFIRNSDDPAPALPDGWAPALYDSAMSATHRDAAATYFYSAFLGLNIPENSAQRVRQFFEETKDFFRAANVDQETRIDLYNGLFTYLKVDRTPTIQVDAFAERFLSEEMGEQFRAHMRRARFPMGAVDKDLREVAGSLRTRRYRFPSSITLSGPTEAMAELVAVSEVVGDDGASWTHITIKGPLEKQE